MRTLLALFASLALANPPLSPPPAVDPAERPVFEVVVQDGQYVPDVVEVPWDTPFQIRFVRKEWNACTREVVFDDLDLRRELPTDVPVTLDFDGIKAGTVEFHCGMDMAHGTIRVEAPP